MAVWFTGWSFGCAMLLGELLKQFTWFTLLFSTPFFVGWIAGAAGLLSTVFGRQQINLAKDRLEFVQHVIVPISRTEVLYKEISGIKVDTADDSSRLTVQSSGKDLTISQHASPKQHEALRDFLYEQIPPIEKPDNSNSPEKSLVAMKRPVCPVDCEWYFEESFKRETKLANQGSWVLGFILTLLGVNLFWNGIVSVFVVKAITVGADWFELLFLTPFVLIGLVMAATLLIGIFDPFRKVSYTFSDREIEWSFKYFGIGRMKTWELAGPVTIGVALERDEFPDEYSDGTDYKLVFTNDSTKKMEIDSLSLAEAEWIATHLENEQATYTLHQTINGTLPAGRKDPFRD